MSPTEVEDCGRPYECLTSAIHYTLVVRSWLQSAELINLTDEHQREDLSNAAIAGGHVHTLQWLRSKEEFELDADEMQWEGEYDLPAL
jgi:hypothetical protein